MKPTAHENPDLAAYALGELQARQATDIHALLVACPAAAHELEQVEAVTDALRQGAPIPQDRLRPEQRHAVLHPTNLPRRMAPLMPRPMPRRPSVFWPVLSGVMKAAAIVTVAGGAYIMGRHVALDETSNTVVVTDPMKPEFIAEADALTPKPAKVFVASPSSDPTPEAVSPVAPALTPVLEKSPIVVVQAPVAQPEAPVVAITPPAAPEVKTKSAVLAAENQRPLSLTTPGKHLAFVNASRQSVDRFALRPSLLRPLPIKLDKSQLLSAPMPLQSPTENKENSKPRTPDLYIHSWRADIASCPWNDTHRLLRVTIQLPADQPAAMSQASYPLQVSFDPNNVREYRQLCERHQPAVALRSAGTHVIWYEFLPNGDPDANKTVATVTLEKGRFTTQTVGPFDSSKLSVQDHGQAWQNAREDFIFDSAVVGFGLLMRGVPQTPKLDHDLVLSLAEKAKGSDANGEHARFIRLVKDATKAAGL